MWYYIEDGKILMTASQETDMCKQYTDEEIVIGFDGQLLFKHETETEEYIKAKEEYDGQEFLNELRKRREVECFSIINRGALWYNTLTEEQLQDLQNWYNAWLDVTETKVMPEKPSWLK